MAHPKYPMLFSPLKVGSIVLKNRIISAPLGSYTDKSKSGIGMIIRGTSGSVPGPRSRIAPGPYCFEDMATSGTVREQVSLIRQRGAKAEFELCHCGLYARVEPGDYAIGPVSFTREDGTEVKGMDEAMMDEVADAYARGAKDAREYGFDAVLLHFGHGWLPTQFLSPHFNRRTDGYGGSFENRVRFPQMIVSRVREAVGPDYPLDMRISGNEHIEGGTSTQEVIDFVRSVQNQIDMVHVSCGLEREPSAMSHMSSSTYFPHLVNVGLSRQFREQLDIPVAVVGAIMTPEEAEGILERGEADAVCIGREIIADPFWVRKAWECRSEDITPCLRCLNCYNEFSRLKESHYGMKSITRCSVNPRYLHEDRVPVELPKASSTKLVYVVGGGPAGMKAAVVAADRGHKVILIEKEEHLGGQLTCANYDESKIDLKAYLDYLRTQVAKREIEVRLSCDVTECVDELRSADCLIVAVGADAVRPHIPGADQGHVMTGIEAYPRQDEIGQRAVIVGGGSIGTELAKLLAHQGKDVTVVEMTDALASNLNEHARVGLLEQTLCLSNVHVMLGAQCTSIGPSSVEVSTPEGLTVVPADTVILAVGTCARRELANSLFGLVQDTDVIGDCTRPGTVADATEEGYYVAASL